MAKLSAEQIRAAITQADLSIAAREQEMALIKSSDASLPTYRIDELAGRQLQTELNLLARTKRHLVAKLNALDLTDHFAESRAAKHAADQAHDADK